jgi:two-component system sensor histidine kinase KdpD
LQDSFERSSQAKALKQSERLKSALLDAVTHDLRTPLTSIKASVTTLLDGERSRERGAAEGQLGNEGRREMLEVIDEEADRLDRFIEGLMELARIEGRLMRLSLRQ